jgi:hypothetical protein
MSAAAECPDVETDLSLDEAFVIIEPYFEAVRERYVGSGLERCSKVRFFCAPHLHDTPRHFAACRDDGLVIYAAPELAAPEIMENTILAVMAHELGHATDFLYPGEFAFGGDDAPAIRRDPESMKRKHWVSWQRSWEVRDDDLVERTADAISHYALGFRYGYAGPCNLQSFASSRARPYGLR